MKRGFWLWGRQTYQLRFQIAVSGFLSNPGTVRIRSRTLSYLCILTIRLITLLRFGIFGVGKSKPNIILLQDIKNRDPILAGRFHADIITVILGKPVTQLLQSFSKGRKEEDTRRNREICQQGKKK